MRETEYQYELVEADDPNRCQAIAGKKQCNLKAVPGGKYCIVHNGNMELARQEKQKVRNYRLNKFKQRVNELCETPEIKNLREEVAIMRMIVEEKINSCEDTHQLIMMSGPIADIVMKVKDLIMNCHKLESSLGELMDKQQLLRFTSELIDIISKELSDQPDKIQLITNRILVSMERIKEERDAT